MTSKSMGYSTSSKPDLVFKLGATPDPARVTKLTVEATNLVAAVAERRGSPGLDYLEVLLESLAALAQEPSTASSTLTVAERKDLIESGTFTEEELAETEAQIADGELDRMIAAAQQDVIVDSLGADEVGALLQRSPSRISHRAGEPSLYSFRVARTRRYPKWQFTSSGEIPGLAAIVPAIPEGAHPASVEGFMRNSSPALLADGETECSPIDWLIGGGSTEDVAEILRQWSWR